MADNTVRYVVYIDGTGAARSGLMGMESAAVATERSIASLNNTLRGMAGAMGIGLGLHSFVDFGKEAVEGAADYETAVKRIKFASDDLAEGAKNIAFIRSEVDKFGIPLQSATDAYGKFLAMLAGSEIPSEKVRKLHDELLLIGKIKGLDEGQLNAAVMNLGKMLESGSLDARHFRPLEQQLSGIGAFVAKELGISIHQLAILRNQGKMTQIDPQVLLTAIEKQAASLEGFLPESLTTIRTGLNQLTTDWVEFKNSLVYDNRAELEALFATLKSGIKYLNDHREGIVSTGKAVLAIGEIWLKYKGAMLLVNAAQAAYSAFMAGYAGNAATMVTATARQTAAYTMQAESVAVLTAAIERLNFVQNAQNASYITTAAGATVANTVGNRYVVSAAAAAAGATGAPMATTAATAATATVSSVVATAVPIALGLILTGYFINKIGDAINQSNRDSFKQDYRMVDDPTDPKGWRFEKTDNVASTKKDIAEYKSTVPGALGVVNAGSVALNPSLPGSKSFGKFVGPKTEKDTGIHDKIMPPNDTVTGQRLITYNISIKEINGIKQNTVQEGGKMDTDRTAEVLRDVIQSILNDSQIRAGY